ncbi:MAG TPA: FG-GAP-like repeat-containing protein, partial [Phycisphaerae bacterium]|nr:FG-GAP-like repeat-containing protein [Phycisphaerae bacterium]
MDADAAATQWGDADAATGLFTDIGAGLTGVSSSSLAWGDYDNDDDLDLIIAGSVGYATRVTDLYRNSAGTFSNSGISLPGIDYGGLAWGDYDNDGDLDLAIDGQGTGSGPRVGAILRNSAGSSFTDIGADITGMSTAAVAWGDYDNDGDLDLVVSGYWWDGTEHPETNLHRNDDGTFTPVPNPFVGVTYGAVAWGDYDADGDLDLAVCGEDSSDVRRTKIYRNDGGTFSDIGATLTGVRMGDLAWGDYDNDGDLDLAVCGTPSTSTYVTKVYRNSGGTFSDIGAGLTGVIRASLAWGDYDNDGDLDLIAAGVSKDEGVITRLYQNNAGSFVPYASGIDGFAYCSLAWGDYDNDGDLDLAVAGTTDSIGSGKAGRIYRNDGAVSNTPPSAPGGLSASVLGTDATFSWAAASDGQTPASGLTYNLRVGTSPGDDDVFGGMADLTTGLRLLPATGNAGHRLSWTLKGLAPDTYYWSVQAIDTAFAGSPWAPEKTLSAHVAQGEIRGIKWNDLDGDRSKDPGEPGLADWIIFIDSDGDTRHDPGEPFATTGPDGSYALTGLSPGTYTVAEEDRPRWTQTYPGGTGTFRFLAGTVGDDPVFALSELRTDPVSEVLIGPSAYYGGGLDFSPSGVLYGACSQLYVVNPATGSYTTVATLHSATLPEITMWSIAFDPSGTLYGHGEGSFGESVLYTIDPATALATPVGTIDALVWGIDFAPDGTLYAGEFDLFTLDPATGHVLSEVGYASIFGFEDIDFAPDGYIYGASNDGQLHRIDPADASSTVLATYARGLWGLASQVLSPGGNPFHAVLVGTDQIVPNINFGNQGMPPVAPRTPDLAAASDTGVSSTDDYTNLDNSSPSKVLRFVVDGAIPGATVTLYDGGLAVGSAVAAGSTVTVPTDGTHDLADGVYFIQARQTEAGKPESAESPYLFVQIDTEAPGSPAPPDLVSSSDSGASQTDNVTNDRTPTFSVPIGAYFRIYRDGYRISGSYQTGIAYTTTTQLDGTYDYTVTALDGAGNESAPSDALTATIDTNGPAVTLTDPACIHQAGATSDIIHHIGLTWNEPLDPDDAANTANYELREDGDDGAFDDGDDTLCTLAPAYTPGTAHVFLDIGGGLLGDGRYRLTVRGAASIHDVAGNRMADDYVRVFAAAPAEDWLGGTDEHWEDAANWSGAVVPEPRILAVFDAPATHQPSLYGNQSVKGLDFRTAGWTLSCNSHTLTVGEGGIAFAGAPTSTIDLGTGNLVVDYTGASPLAEIADMIRSGLNLPGGGNWDGTGITSSAAAAHPQGLTAVGVIDNGDTETGIGGLTEFGGVPVDETSVLAACTWWGDVNLDGVVDSNDYDRIDTNYVRWINEGRVPDGGWRWAVGDLDYDKMIDSNDYDLIDKAFLLQHGPTAAGGAASVAGPDPLPLTASSPKAR